MITKQRHSMRGKINKFQILNVTFCLELSKTHNDPQEHFVFLLCSISKNDAEDWDRKMAQSGMTLVSSRINMTRISFHVYMSTCVTVWVCGFVVARLWLHLCVSIVKVSSPCGCKLLVVAALWCHRIDKDTNTNRWLRTPWGDSQWQGIECVKKTTQLYILRLWQWDVD